MAVAGKVAITLSTENGGAWSADVTYDRLVAVKHNNNLYISRKTVANVEPPNDEFWFLAMEGFSGEDIENIIDGTTQVGNAKTLDGHGAEYFAPLSNLGGMKFLSSLPKGITYQSSTMKELIGAMPDNSLLCVRSVGAPLVPREYSNLVVFKQSNQYAFAFAKSQYNNFLSFGSIGTTQDWLGWNDLDLANCVKQYAQVIYVGSEYEAVARTIALQNSKRKMLLTIDADGNFSTWDTTNSKNVLSSTADGTNTFNGTASGNLPLTGGTVANATFGEALRVKRTSAYDSVTTYENSDGVLGYIGMGNAKKPIYTDATKANTYEILHTGNKPTGTYTGNGSGTYRTIATGGIGSFAVIYSENGTVLLAYSGGVVIKDGNASGFLAGNFRDGVIAISATDVFINASGVTYKYEVH